MSKSLGNFYTLRDVIEKGYSGREVRYALMRVHYRAQLNFTWEGMDEARQSLGRIDDWLQRLREKAAGKGAAARTPAASRQQFEEALDDDLNISAALGFLFESIRETNREWIAATLSAEPQTPGWNGGNAWTTCSFYAGSKRRFRRRLRSWRKRGCKQGLQKICEKVINCATN